MPGRHSATSPNLGSLYHYDEATGIDVSYKANLPWYIKLVVTPKTVSEAEDKSQRCSGDNGELFTCDIHFINTLDGSEWHPDGLITRQDADGQHRGLQDAGHRSWQRTAAVRLIEGYVDSAGGTIEFEASDFSLLAVSQDRISPSIPCTGGWAVRDVMP